MPAPLTRLAPSPTGALHLGNARTFLINWLLARQNGWKILLRIEDLDGPRIKPDAAQQAIDDLNWLGIDWDQGPVYQSTRTDDYTAAVQKLLATGHAYPCICSRKEVETAASAPHAEDGSARYPGTCRGRFATVEAARKFTGKAPAIRFQVPDEKMEWTDQFAGPQSHDLAALGDFVIAKADGTPAYQLATTVDDAAAGVTHIVRGDDLLDSTPRQILLHRALQLPTPLPHYFHLPLVVGPDGRRLAKRHGDTRLATYRNAGLPVQRILSMLAGWCGVATTEPIANLNQLIDRFELKGISHQPIVHFESMMGIR